MAAAVAVFEAIDALSPSTSSLNGGPAGPMANILIWLPIVSPGIAGAVAAWLAPAPVWAGLLAAAAAMWARIGVDRLIGALHGAHVSAEARLVLIFYFGLPWTITALLGAVVAFTGRALARSRRPR